MYVVCYVNFGTRATTPYARLGDQVQYFARIAREGILMLQNTAKPNQTNANFQFCSYLVRSGKLLRLTNLNVHSMTPFSS
jgi:hypothetical protein